MLDMTQSLVAFNFFEPEEEQKNISFQFCYEQPFKLRKFKIYDPHSPPHRFGPRKRAPIMYDNSELIYDQNLKLFRFFVHDHSIKAYDKIL